MTRVLEYQCQAEKEEASGDFEREPRTWYHAMPGRDPRRDAASPRRCRPPRRRVPAVRRCRRAGSQRLLPGRPRRRQLGARAARRRVDLTPPGRGVIIDPPDRKLPYQPWARAERRAATRRSAATTIRRRTASSRGVPRSLYVPSPFHILQTPTHVVFLHERMSWRIVSLDGRHAPARHDPPVAGRFDWPLGGRHARRRDAEPQRQDVAERGGRRRQPRGDGGRAVHAGGRQDRITYEATVTDPLVYTRPWTIAMPLNRQPERAARGGVPRGQSGSAAPEGRPGRVRAQSAGRAGETADETD